MQSILIYLLLPSTHAPSLFYSIVINLSHNRLTKLPTLQEQSELGELDVSRNKISEINSNELTQLKSLKTLRLSENFIGMCDEFKARFHGVFCLLKCTGVDELKKVLHPLKMRLKFFNLSH